MRGSARQIQKGSRRVGLITSRCSGNEPILTPCSLFSGRKAGPEGAVEIEPRRRGKAIQAREVLMSEAPLLRPGNMVTR